MKYVTKKMYDKAHIIVPHVRDHFREIMILATILQILSIIAGLILFYYSFYLSPFLIIPSIFSFIFYILVSLNKSNMKDIYAEIRRQTCKQFKKK
jgi:hypothetical protein